MYTYMQGHIDIDTEDMGTYKYINIPVNRYANADI